VTHNHLEKQPLNGSGTVVVVIVGLVWQFDNSSEISLTLTPN